MAKTIEENLTTILDASYGYEVRNAIADSIAELKNIINKLPNGAGDLMLPTKVPSGSVLEFAGKTAPSGYLICGGQAVSRSAYPDLYAAIGTTYGQGDGSTTFNLPKRSGFVGVGLDSSQPEFNSIGKTGGAKTHTLSVAEMPAHQHMTTSVVAAGSFTASTDMKLQSGTSYNTAYGKEPTVGGNQPHNNLQPYVVMNYIIKI